MLNDFVTSLSVIPSCIVLTLTEVPISHISNLCVIFLNLVRKLVFSKFNYVLIGICLSIVVELGRLGGHSVLAYIKLSCM